MIRARHSSLASRHFPPAVIPSRRFSTVTPSAARNLLFFSLVSVLLSLLALPSSAQVITGTPPFGSFGGGPDVINLANLNAHLTIPVFARAGRGIPFNFYVTYDSSVWYPVTSGGTTSWQPVANWGWGGSEVNIGTVIPRLISSSSGTCGSLPHLGITSTSTWAWTYQDGFGTPHPFSATSIVYINSCTGGYTTGFTQEAVDDSGYSLTVNGSTVTSLYSADGNLINTSAGSIEDRNGNEITASSGVFTDTLGTTALTIAGSGTPTSPTTYAYTAPGGAASYTVKYTTYSVQTNFGCTGIGEYGTNGTTTANLVSEIDLPEYNPTSNPNARYTFSYEQRRAKPAFTRVVLLP
jgi:hypothetical protein